MWFNVSRTPKIVYKSLVAYKKERVQDNTRWTFTQHEAKPGTMESECSTNELCVLALPEQSLNLFDADNDVNIFTEIFFRSHYLFASLFLRLLSGLFVVRFSFFRFFVYFLGFASIFIQKCQQKHVM